MSEKKIIKLEPNKPKSEKTKSEKTKSVKTEPTNEPKQVTLAKNDYKYIKYKEKTYYLYNIVCSPIGIFLEEIKKSNTVSKQKHSFSPILDENFDLLNIYITQDNRRKYEIKINDELYYFYKAEFIDFLKEQNLSFVSKNSLEIYIEVILRDFEVKNNITPIHTYPTIGIFTDENNELIVVYPTIEGIKLFGENDVQKEVIKKIEEKELDLEGSLTKAFYDLIHLTTLSRITRLTITAHTVISTFFYALKNELSIFPNYFLFGHHGIGKTTEMECKYCFLHGIPLRIPDDVGSLARMTEFSTGHTCALPIDDIDDIVEESMGFIKVSSTRKTSKKRMDTKQRMHSKDVYTAFVGTANTDKFIRGSKNDAFRKRCLIDRHTCKIDPLKISKKFEISRKLIKSGKIYGYYLLKKSIEFINKTIDDDSLTSYQKLVKIIDQNKIRIIKYVEKKEIKWSDSLYIEKKEIKWSDSRRIEIYALIYTGLQFWNYVFECNGFKSRLFKHALNLEYRTSFFKLMDYFEESENISNIEKAERIIAFYENHINKYGALRDANSNVIITIDFIHGYDRWARLQGYEPLKTLTSLKRLQSEILNEEIKVKSIRFKDLNTGIEFIKRALIFDFDKLCEKIEYFLKIIPDDKKNIHISKEQYKHREKPFDDYADQSEIDF